MGNNARREVLLKLPVTCCKFGWDPTTGITAENWTQYWVQDGGETKRRINHMLGSDTAPRLGMINCGIIMREDQYWIAGWASCGLGTCLIVLESEAEHVNVTTRAQDQLTADGVMFAVTQALECAQ